jgi:flagellar hook-length control protein FliK
MDDKIRDEQIQKRSLLGVKEKTAPKKENQTAVAPRKVNRPAKEAEIDNAEVIYLQQLMGELQSLLTNDTSKPGEWTFDLEGLGVLDKLALSAGMDDVELGLLKKQLEENGSLGLADLFAALEKHFDGLNQDLQVTVPETNLAFLESLLAKMGVSAENITSLSDKAVTGLSELDIIAYLQSLAQIEKNNSQIITLSNWDLDQLQAMLSQAGMSDESMQDLIPEVNFQLGKSLQALGLSPAQDFTIPLSGEHLPKDFTIPLSVERLQNLLEHAVAGAEAAGPKVDVPGFIGELKSLLSQAGFEGKNVGWTPVVQESMTAVYQELQKMVDLAKVNIEKINKIQVTEEGLTADWLSSGKKVPVAGAEKSSGDGTDLFFGKNGDNVVDEEIVQVSASNTQGKSLDSFESHLNASSQEVTVPGEQGSVTEARVLPPRVRLAAEMQQFTVDQISQGVMRGLRSSQHHMTLTLYPKELGEVKVDLQVRESHIVVSFAMENSRVKEALESNMQDFKDNLQKQGFSLQECFVSVDQNNTDDARQRFEEAWERLVAQTGREKEGGQPGDVMAMVDGRHGGMNQGGTISLFV